MLFLDHRRLFPAAVQCGELPVLYQKTSTFCTVIVQIWAESVPPNVAWYSSAARVQYHPGSAERRLFLLLGATPAPLHAPAPNQIQSAACGTETSASFGNAFDFGSIPFLGIPTSNSVGYLSQKRFRAFRLKTLFPS
eukprot:326075-Rhodomonas_salina.1